MHGEQRYDIDTLLDGVVTLPTMPASLARITQLLNDPNSSLQDVGRAIATDPSISIKTLRLVNSVYYGLEQKVSTVEHAVALLGTKVIRNLVLSASAFNAMQEMSAGFVKHSVACGMAMRALAEHGHLRAHFNSPDEAFVFGLLHDIGKVVLYGFLPEECAAVAAIATERGIAWYEAEREVIGTDHAELGARLAQNWKLSHAIAQAIAGHHDLSRVEPEFRSLAATLCVANYISTACGYPSSEGVGAEAQDEMWEVLGLDTAGLLHTMERVFALVPDMGELLAIND
jgi:putative nucleotidyltransferase with HDIG domain